MLKNKRKMNVQVSLEPLKSTLNNVILKTNRYQSSSMINHSMIYTGGNANSRKIIKSLESF